MISNKIKHVVHFKDVGDKPTNEERNLKRKLFMVEDFLANVSIRTQQVLDIWKLSNYSFLHTAVNGDEPNFIAYQNALLNIEIIKQHFELKCQETKKLREENISINNELNETVQMKIKIEEYYKNVMIENAATTKKLKKIQRTNANLVGELSILTKQIEENEHQKQKEEVDQRMQLSNLELRNQQLQKENEDFRTSMKKLENEFEELKPVLVRNKFLQNLVKKLKVTIKKKTEDLDRKTEENHAIKESLAYLENNTCHCRIPIDIDGVIEENKRLWDAYNHLQMEYISCENEKDEFKKKIEMEHEKHKVSRDEIKSNLKNSILSKSKEKLLKPNDSINREIRRKSATLQASNLKKSILTQSKEKLVKQTEDLEALRDKITQLVVHINDSDTKSKKKELDYNNLEEQLLNTQEKLIEYKESFQQMEDLLDDKREEYERKLSDLTKALDQESEENYILKNLLSNSLIKALVDVHVKMEEYEEILDASEGFSLNLKEKIEDLREICEDEIIKIVDAVDDELEEYKFAIVQIEKMEPTDDFLMVVKETVY